jgi:ParB-like chromosome segregation protein Spo0J
MIIQKIPINKINPARYNPRKDLQPGDPEYEKIKRSIMEFDLVEPLVINKKTGNLVGGHQRLKVLKELGKTEVDVVIVDLSESREKALNVALNKAQGEWDLPKLKDLLQELDTGEFDIGITGFDEDEIEDLINKYSVQDIDALLNELDLSESIDKPIWAVIRTDAKNQEILENALNNLEEYNIKVERSYEI